ncbi:anti-repressor protein [Streptococcus oralis]|uniref:Anti-repressor protein n=1 Tax=Streptococcus oralis TaxID=1303 RepID=A0A139RG06_STROR|nr:Rha family transcriptional regulator [Streptococcus oralis]KXU13690.1 anti-repressor protein [Streptococcus oralis]
MARRNYGKFLDEFLSETGMTGADMARAIGIAPDTIQSIRRGTVTNPQYATKKKINEFALQYRRQHKEELEVVASKTEQGSLFGSEGIFRDMFKTTDNQGNELNMIEVDGVAYTTSRIIAEKLGKKHKHVLEFIDFQLMNGLAELWADPRKGKMFIESSYIHEQNKQEYREILVNQDGCTLYMFNIQGYQREKMAFIQAFRAMEQEIKARHEQPAQAPQTAVAPITDDLDYIKHRLALLQDYSDIQAIQNEMKRISCIADLIKESDMKK